MKARIRQAAKDTLAILIIAVAWISLFSLACGGLGVLIKYLLDK